MLAHSLNFYTKESRALRRDESLDLRKGAYGSNVVRAYSSNTSHVMRVFYDLAFHYICQMHENLMFKIFTKFRISQCPIRDLSRKIKKYFYFSLTRATFLRRHQDSDCVNNYKRFFLAEKKNEADFFSHGQKLKARVEISIRRKFWVRRHPVRMPPSQKFFG